MSSESQNSGSDNNSKLEKSLNNKALQEQHLKKMESILAQSALGVHILFNKQEITDAHKDIKDNSDFYDLKKMQQVQDVLTELISKKTYFQKLAYLQTLDRETLNMTIRAYFHIIENNILDQKISH